MSKSKDLLEKIGNETVKLIKDEITKKNLIKTGDLKDSIKYKLVKNGSQYSLEFEEIYYGEYLDQGTRYIRPPREFFEKIIKEQLDKYEDDIADAYFQDMIDEIDI